MPERVTVFGGSGFVGRHLAERLAEAGANVRVGVRRPQAARFAGPAGRIESVRADVLDEPAVRAAVEGAAAVINLVGVVSAPDSRTFKAIHEQGARRVAEAARAAGAARLIHVSALGVGATAPSMADRSKAAGEATVRRAFPEATIVRPSLVFGPGDHFFTRFAAMARTSPVIPLIGGGRTRFQPVDIGDAVEAFVAILADPATRGQTYGLGGPRVYSFRELMELVLAETGRRRLLLPVPFAVARVLAAGLELLPTPPLTRDQVRLLATDKVITDERTLADLGIEPASVEAVLPRYLR